MIEIAITDYRIEFLSVPDVENIDFCLERSIHFPEDRVSLCRGQNSVNPVWDGSLTFVKATEMSTPLGCFCDERTPEPTLSR